jgi:aminoglycoside phosphotransferase (APT) family kinase protein
VRRHVGGATPFADTGALLRLWDELVATPPWTGPPVWIHGDLHPGNLLAEDGRLAAVIDVVDLCAGDPATDLAVGWMLFAPPTRAVLFDAAGGVDVATRARARGWALSLALVFLASGDTDPALAGLGRRTLARVIDPDG